MRRKKRPRREFSREFREEAVKLMNERLDDGVALAQIARDLALHPDQLRKWAREMGKWTEQRVTAAEPAEITDADRDQEIKRLRRELEVMKQERDFLKKATAFFAKESH